MDSLLAALSDRYTIEREIGRGGMATVYLARDLRHERNVALKVLSPELGAVLGVERFLAEIKVTANLQHPNLLPLFDSGEANGLLFYVMPFVEGESLRAKLEREKQLPIDEAVRIATAVASALDYAHRHGVIHRDLKPENILLQDGQPVVADFGIALAVSNAGGGRITQTGLSLGTPQYMSPEQATGDRTIDGRTDIYSLAAVLYEMLAGEAPHAGGTAQAVIAKLMTEEPRPLTVLRRAVPPHIDAAIQRALEKLPADRFATAAQFAEALAGTRDAGIVTRTGRIRPSKVKQWVPWTVAAAGVVAGVAGVVARPRPTPQPIHFTIPLRAGVTFDVTRSNIAVSPDGSHIVYSASPGGLFQMYARALGDDESRPISGTEASVYPFFSPDGAWIGFRSSDGLLKKVPATGGPAVTIGKAPGFGGAVWGPDDVITFSRGALAGMARIRASGGQPTEFVPRDSALRSSVQPTLLPNGDVLFTSIKGNETHLALATPDGHVTQLDQSGFNPMFVRPSYIVFGSMEGVLSVAKFDLRTHRFAGPAIGMVEGVFARPNGSVLASVSRDGNLLAYVRGSAKMRLGLVTATGETQVLPGDQRRFRHPRVSPDGTRIAVDVAALDHSIDVWVYDIRSAGLTRLTFDGRSQDPIWSPDGKRVAFSVTDQGSAGVDTYVVAADGSSKPQLLIGGGGNQWPAAFLGDGRSLVFDELLPGGRMHTSLLKADGKTEILAGSDQFTMRLPAVSPDGKWLAYTSNESGVTAVFVRALGGAGGGKWQVSLADGTQPVWSRDNKTIFYRAEGRIIAASVAASGNSFTITSRKNFADDHFSMENTINFDAHPDGKHLAVVVPMDEGAQISVVVNWMEEVKRRFAGR